MVIDGRIGEKGMLSRKRTDQSTPYAESFGFNHIEPEIKMRKMWIDLFGVHTHETEIVFLPTFCRVPIVNDKGRYHS